MLTTSCSMSDLDAAKARLDADGYVVIEEALDADLLERLRSRLIERRR